MLQKYRVQVLTGTEGELDLSQGLFTHPTGAPRVKSAFGVNLTL